VWWQSESEEEGGGRSTRHQPTEDEDVDEPLVHIFDEDEWQEHTYVLDREGSVTVKALGWTQGGCCGVWGTVGLEALVRIEDIRRRIGDAGSVLELGAGCGAAGLACAQIGARRVVITDGDKRELPLMRQNIEQYLQCSDGVSPHAATTLAWGTAHAESHADLGSSKSCFDVIITIETTYVREYIKPLIESIAFFLKRGGRAYIYNSRTATFERAADNRTAVYAAIKTCGLVCQEVTLLQVNFDTAIQSDSYLLEVWHDV